MVWGEDSEGRESAAQEVGGTHCAGLQVEGLGLQERNRSWGCLLWNYC